VRFFGRKYREGNNEQAKKLSLILQLKAMTTFIVTTSNEDSENVQKNLNKIRGIKSVRKRKVGKKKSLSDVLVSESSLAKDWLSKEDDRWDKIFTSSKKGK